MAGKPRMAGARAALAYFGVPDVDARAERYAAAKQEQIVKLIEEGRFMAFPDALRFILAVKDLGMVARVRASERDGVGTVAGRVDSDGRLDMLDRVAALTAERPRREVPAWPSASPRCSTSTGR
jgi:hypothetical protein